MKPTIFGLVTGLLLLAASCERPEEPATPLTLQEKPQRPGQQEEPFPPKRTERWVMFGHAVKYTECDGTYTVRVRFNIWGEGHTLEALENSREASLIIDWENMTFKNYASNYGQYYGLATGQVFFVDNENMPDKFSTVTFDPCLSWQAYREAGFYQKWDIVWFGDDYTSPGKNHPFWYSDTVREELQQLRTRYNLPLNQFAILHNNEGDFTNSTMYFVVLPYSE
ncbi:MAG: hypothetical protein LBK03_00625 [Bacteroidales bacterium]|jgi:hypothetical protein|nr:hypothetical protein [Bacteroidales bacterium]